MLTNESRLNVLVIHSPAMEPKARTARRSGPRRRGGGFACPYERASDLYWLEMLQIVRKSAEYHSFVINGHLQQYSEGAFQQPLGDSNDKEYYT